MTTGDGSIRSAASQKRKDPRARGEKKSKRRVWGTGTASKEAEKKKKKTPEGKQRAKKR